MRSAVYYPHTEIASEDLLKSALLMWDQLEYLVPWEPFQTSYANPQFAEAIELIGKAHVPLPEEQEEAHTLVADLVRRPLPPSFLFRSTGDSRSLYEMYPQKFMTKTWELLHDAKIAGHPLPNADYPVAESAGLSLMALLADCCAGDTRRRVTDQTKAYAGLTSIFTAQAGDSQSDSVLDRLVPVTLKTINLESISLQKLIDFRKREGSANGHAIRDLRHRYVDKLEGQVKSTLGMRERDKGELERQFQQDMRDDLKDLRDELRFEATQTIFSKEMLVAAVAAAGSVLSPVLPQTTVFQEVLTLSGAPAAVGGLIAAGNKFMGARRSLLKKHPMSYLYELKGGLRL